jgi:N-lysine methyltransferase SETD6
VATRGIEPDTVLFKIPRSSVINTLTSDLASRIPDLFKDGNTYNNKDDEDIDLEDESSQDPWSSLILVMIYEFLKGEKSSWKEYFDILPETFDTPMFWSQDEIDELQASSMVSKIGKNDADDMFKSKVIPVISAHSSVFYPEGATPLSELELLHLAHRMGSTIMSYAFDLENDDDGDEAEPSEEWVEDREGKGMLGMVPMADVLNADAEFNVGRLCSTKFS